ncbi:MAG: M23 family metallopeptidase [Clostridia bacterium]|nr:M23 family metallopeptidase [Clostridia bacterium]
MNNAKRNKTNLALYIVLALIIAAVVCMTVFSIATASKRKGQNPPVDRTESDKYTDSQKDSDKPQDTGTPDSSGNDDEQTTAPSTDGPSLDVSVPTKINITEPIKNGYLLKRFEIDIPVYSLTMNDYRVHTGIDILAEPGEPVMAIAEGTVQNIYEDPMMGKCITISHSGGLTSYYMGLSDEVCEGIEEGAPVYCGQNISSVGDSTLIEIAEESHLHFELKKNGKYVDPMAYFNYKATTSEGVIDENYEG